MAEGNGLPPATGGKFSITQAIDDLLENAAMIAQEREVLPPDLKPFSGVIMTRASEVETESISWLWYPYLPLGKLCLLGGDPGLGKTWVALGLAAAFSRGEWPFMNDGAPSMTEPGTTLFCASEDGVGDTLKPRLATMGADLTRILFLKGKLDAKGHTQRVALNEEDLLVNALTACGAKLIIFDPFQRFLPAKTKMNEMETVSPVVSALMRVAARTGATVLLLGHLNKSKQDTIGYKFLGSVDWFAAARSAMIVMKDPETPLTGRFLYQIKNSLAPQAGGVGFTLAAGETPFSWGAATTVSAEEMFASPVNGKSNRAETARFWLLQELSEGEQPSQELIERAALVDISRNALFEAKKTLGVTARKKGFFGGWLWCLPDKENTKSFGS